MAEKQHDQEAARREKILAKQAELKAKFRKEDTAAEENIKKLEAPLTAARRERFELGSKYRNAMQELQREQELCERELRKSANPEILALLNEADELERSAVRGSATQSGEDAPVSRVRQVRNEAEGLALLTAAEAAKRLPELRAKLPGRDEMAMSWPPYKEQEEDQRGFLGAIIGSKRREARA